MMSVKTELASLVASLPEIAGVYQYLDKTGKIIYVGKAKNLKRRVSSYFNKKHDSVKLNLLVRNICDIRYVVVDSEEDALHLENSLIKEHQPRYNAMLKDDKSYPWICVTNEAYPRVYQTRNVIKNGATYFGPYSHVPMVKLLLSLFSELYPLRTCRLDLSLPKVSRGTYRVCLQYHLKKCEGPCEGLIGEEEYRSYIDQVRQVLKGDTDLLIDHLHAQMSSQAEQLLFERAQQSKQRIELLSQFQSKTVVVSPYLNRLSVCSLIYGEEASYFNFLSVVKGSIVSGYTFEYSGAADSTPEELLARGIEEVAERFSLHRDILVPFLPDPLIEKYNFTVPQRGDKKLLLDLSLKNARQYQVDRLKQKEKINPESRSERILKVMQKDLQLDQLPTHIECFDNSNIQGAYPVAACVVFKKAKPSKREYRHFNIKTVEGPNDFASMQEILRRRYSRLLEEGASLPDLIVVDGGKGQLHVAYDVLKELGLDTRIAIIGIAKRLEEIFFPGDPIPLYLNKNSETLKVIQHLRDEAHRFGITFHRSKRSKHQILSELDEVQGIGPVLKERLMKRFKTAKGIKESTQEMLAEVVGPAKAALLYAHFHGEVGEKEA